MTAEIESARRRATQFKSTDLKRQAELDAALDAKIASIRKHYEEEVR